MTQRNDELSVPLCGECEYWKYAGIPTIGFCNNTQSDHYGHVILGKHPAPGCFCPRNAESRKKEDDALRLFISKDSSNGAYATKICRKCHSFWSEPGGCLETAEIVDQCKKCFDKP